MSNKESFEFYSQIQQARLAQIQSSPYFSMCGLNESSIQNMVVTYLRYLNTIVLLLPPTQHSIESTKFILESIYTRRRNYEMLLRGMMVDMDLKGKKEIEQELSEIPQELRQAEADLKLYKTKYADLQIEEKKAQKQYDEILNYQNLVKEYLAAENKNIDELIRQALEERQKALESKPEYRFKYNIDYGLKTLELSLYKKDLRGYETFRNSTNNLLGTNGSRSFYMSKNDFLWSLNYDSIRADTTSIQNIILNLYQPISQDRNTMQLVNAVATGMDKFLNVTLKVIGGLLAGKAGEEAATAVRSGVDWAATEAIRNEYNSKLNKLSLNPNILLNSSIYSANNPMFWIQRLFHKGKWLNTYLLPFVSQGKVKTDYLHNSKDSDAWTIGGLTDGLSLNSTMQQIIQNGLSISLPYAPIYLMDNPHNATYGEIPLDFYLINKNNQYLGKNFLFLIALFAGTQWMNMSQGFIIAPNVYHVLVPGRFMIQWASMTMSILTVGKLRTNAYMAARYGDKGNNFNANNIIELKSIDGETLWPLCWHITLNIRPLTPWNFNTYIDYHAHGFGLDRRKLLKNNLVKSIDAPDFLNLLFNRKVRVLRNEADILNLEFLVQQYESTSDYFQRKEIIQWIKDIYGLIQQDTNGEIYTSLQQTKANDLITKLSEMGVKI